MNVLSGEYKKFIIQQVLFGRYSWARGILFVQQRWQFQDLGAHEIRRFRVSTLKKLGMIANLKIICYTRVSNASHDMVTSRKWGGITFRNCMTRFIKLEVKFLSFVALSPTE